MDERTVVGVEVRLTGDKTTRGYFQRIADAQLSKALDNKLRDALTEIMTARRIMSGSLGVRTGSYGETFGKSIEDQSVFNTDLERSYRDWCARMKGHGTAKLCIELITEGNSAASIASNYKMQYAKVLRLIKKGLQEFANIRGYGEKKPVKIPPTPSQWAMLQVIAQMKAGNNGISPTHEEIAAETGTSKQAVAAMIKRMGERGHVSFVPARERSLVILA